jgi:hypothetical protein
MSTQPRSNRGRPLLAAALQAAARGWPVFPLHPYTKFPAVKDWRNRATTDPEQITRWWTSTAYNIGADCGRAGLLVVDLDDGRNHPPPGEWARHGVTHGRQVLQILRERASAPQMPDTYTVATPSGGEHRYFLAPPGLALGNTAGERGNGLGPLIDTRGQGGFIILPGSLRRTGGQRRRYEVTTDAPVAPLPQWIATALTPAPEPMRHPPLRWPPSNRQVQAYIRTVAEGVRRAAPGTRNSTLFKAACRLGERIAAGLLDETDAAATLREAANVHIGVDGCTAREVHNTITSGLTEGRRNPRWTPDHTA